MRTLGLVGVRRDKHVRTTIPAEDGIRAGAAVRAASLPPVEWAEGQSRVTMHAKADVSAGGTAAGERSNLGRANDDGRRAWLDRLTNPRHG